MEINLDQFNKNQLSELIPNEIPNSFIIFLNTNQEKINHNDYTTILTQIYEYLISKDKSNSTKKVILIPKKEIFPKYEKIGIGGTFDILHCGHFSLFQSGLFSSKKFFIGLTGEKLLQNKKCKDKIKSFEIRKQQVEEFLNEIKKWTEIPYFEIEEINTPEGPAGSDKEMTAVVVSKETLKGIDMINEIRKKNNLNPIDGVVIELIGSGNGNKVSSSDLREQQSN